MSQQAGALASEKEARDVAEAARESEWSGPSFVRELFLGRFRLDSLARLNTVRPVAADIIKQPRMLLRQAIHWRGQIHAYKIEQERVALEICHLISRGAKDNRIASRCVTFDGTSCGTCRALE